VSTPLVTLVTPTYRQGRFLEDAIRSVLAQDYPAIEYAVVDGASDDGTVDVIRRYEDRLAWWTSERDRGQADALNRAFTRAGGEILGWLAADDTLLPGAVSRVVEALECDADALLVYGDAMFVTEEGAEMFRLHAREPDVDWMTTAVENVVVQPGSLFRRRAWELAGPFDVDAYYFFDFEFALRVARHGRLVRVPDLLATYRVHPESKSIGAPARKARDYARIAERLPPTGRRTAHRRAAEYFYEALEPAAARRHAVLARAPGLTLKTLLPAPLVRRLRARRRRGQLVPSAPT
jgi:glycosyltransferase involved in cell wall biosynthesis